MQETRVRSPGQEDPLEEKMATHSSAGDMALIPDQRTEIPPSMGQLKLSVKFSSVQFIRSVVSDSLRPHDLQHARPPCPSPTPGVH